MSVRPVQAIASLICVLILGFITGSLIYLLLTTVFIPDPQSLENIGLIIYDEGGSIAGIVGRFFVITAFGVGAAYILGRETGKFLSMHAANPNWSYNLLVTMTIYLSRFPAIFIGLVGYFLLVVQFDAPWGLPTQCLVFFMMVLPTAIDVCRIGKDDPSAVTDGVILGTFRVWLEFVVMFWIIAFTAYDYTKPDPDVHHSISQFIGSVCEGGIMPNNPVNSLMVSLVAVSAITALINWFFRNYALRQK